MADIATEKGREKAVTARKKKQAAKAETAEQHAASMRAQAEAARPDVDSITDKSTGTQVLVVLGEPGREVVWRKLRIASTDDAEQPVMLIGVEGEQPDPTPLDPAQRGRLAESDPRHSGLRARALRSWIVDGKTMGQQIDEAEQQRLATEAATKRQNRSDAQKRGRAQTGEATATGERESTPLLPELAEGKGKGYFAWAVENDTADARFLGFFEGDNRQKMAAAAREELRRQLAGNDKGAEKKYRIISVRPNHVRVTPAID